MLGFTKILNFNMKRILLVQVFLFGIIIVKAQQDPLLSHIFFNKVFLNPAFAGNQGDINVNIISRQQWVGFGDGAPKTTALTINSPINILGINSGIGFSMANDQLGFEKNFSGSLDYAYIHSLGTGNLCFGLQLGIFNKSLDGTFLPPDGSSNDPVIPKSKEQSLIFDMGIGALYTLNDLYIAFSSSHLTQPKFKFPTNDLNYLKRHYYLMSGYRIGIQNNPIELYPNVLVAFDGSSPQLTINLNAVYNKKFWGGVTYRTLDAIDLNVGIELFNGIKIGYAYGLNFSKLIKTNTGSHEVMLGYNFNLGFDKAPQKYRSVRFL